MERKQELKIFSHSLNEETQSNLSVREAQKSHSPTIQDTEKADLSELRKSIIRSLKRTIKFFGIDPETDPSVSNEQIVDLVNLFVRKYYYWTIADLTACFNQVKSNPKYTRFYGRVDASIIMSWFATYDNDKCMMIEETRIDNRPPENKDFCTREEYYELLRARIAGGDLYANEEMEQAIRTDLMMKYGFFKCNM